MPINVTCPNCFREYRLKDEMLGKSFRCKNCSAAVKAEPNDDLVESPPPRREAKSRNPSAKKSRKRTKGNNATYWILGGGVGALLLLGMMCFGCASFLANLGMSPEERAELERTLADQEELDLPDQGGPSTPFPLSEYPAPEFPELPLPESLPESDVKLYRVNISNPGKPLQPGFNTEINVYMPDGDHAPASLPLVLVAPAGTRLIYGNSVDGSDYHEETLPYAKEGAVVIHYSLDGYLADPDNARDSQFMAAYSSFRSACAGMVNCRNAIEFALQRIPAVDPNRIVVAGHSSAGTLALLMSEHEPRLAACIAYCPCSDVEARVGPFANELKKSLKGCEDMPEFLTKSSPRTHINHVQCPIFLFHSSDDTNTPYAGSVEFTDMVKSAGKDIELSQPPAFGDHYTGMIEEGIPRGIRWLKSRKILE
ncbi:MAG: prolyl oligopeptidase family serine peptidase [Planctomycetaceae bacterium]